MSQLLVQSIKKLELFDISNQILVYVIRLGFHIDFLEDSQNLKFLVTGICIDRRLLNDILLEKAQGIVIGVSLSIFKLS